MFICSYPTNGLVRTIAPEHQTSILQLHLTSRNVFISCILSAYMFVKDLSYQLPCILHSNPTISHVCNNCIRPFTMSFTVAFNQQTSITICYSNIQTLTTFKMLQFSLHTDAFLGKFKQSLNTNSNMSVKTLQCTALNIKIRRWMASSNMLEIAPAIS